MGTLVACIVMGLWLAHLVWTLTMPVVLLSSPFPYLQIRIQGYLYTGLFITAHGSMHGSISKNQKINRLLGQLSVWLFTAFPYQRMFDNHMAHHLSPGTIH